MIRLGSTDVLIMYLPLFLCFWCWHWASMYCWNMDSFMSNLLCFILQLIFNFTTLIRVSTPSFCHSRENFVFDSRLGELYKKKLLWVKSYLWSSQLKTTLCLCILTPNNISETLMTAYFGYFSDILHVVHNHSSSARYHLTRWQKQTCRFASVIWVEHSKVLFDWGCESCVWIVWQYLLGFFWCYFLALDCILLGWTICLCVCCSIKLFL